MSAPALIQGVAPFVAPDVFMLPADLAWFRGAFMRVPVVRIRAPTFERRLFCRDESWRGSDATWGNRSQWGSKEIGTLVPSKDATDFFQPIAHDRRKWQRGYQPDATHKAGDDDKPPARRSPGKNDSLEDAYIARIDAGLPVVDTIHVRRFIPVDEHADVPQEVINNVESPKSFTWGMVNFADTTPQEEWEIEFWNRKLWQLLRAEVKSLAIPPDESCARLAEIESQELKEWFTEPARSICWQDDYGNMSGLSTYVPVRKPKRDDTQLIKGIEIVQKAGAKTDVDGIIIRLRLGFTIEEEARLKGIGSRKMRDMVRERERVLRRHAVESQGPGENAAWKAAIANTYSGETPTGWHILVRFPQAKPRVYPLDMGSNDGEAELQEAILILARRQAFQMFLDKIDKKGFKYLGLDPTTLNGDPKVLAIRKHIVGKTIQAFRNGKIRDLTPTSLKI
jgi:hypothetical protein